MTRQELQARNVKIMAYLQTHTNSEAAEKEQLSLNQIFVIKRQYKNNPLINPDT